MATDMEIVDFHQPRGNTKNLYITNLVYTGCSCLSENIIEDSLYKACSRFGLVYEVQLFSTKRTIPPAPAVSLSKVDYVSEPGALIQGENGVPASPTTSCGCPQRHVTTEYFYAFVKFFSSLAARLAKRSLHLTHFAGKEAVKVNFAQRKGLEKEDVMLNVSRCKELANFYLGYNGWSSNVRLLGHDMSEPSSTCTEWSCEIVYKADIFLTDSRLKAEGVGSCEETLSLTDALGEIQTTARCKIQATARCKKRALERALQNAFSKILIVVLGCGKVYTEVDTTLAELVHYLYSPEEVGEFTVTELAEEPEEDPSEGQPNQTLDQANVDILLQLEEGS